MAGLKKTCCRRPRWPGVAAHSARSPATDGDPRVANQLGAAAEPAGVVAEPARVPVELALLRGGQAPFPGRPAGVPHVSRRFRHGG